MNPIFNTFQMTVGDKEFILADIIKSSQSIGICSVNGRTNDPNDRFPLTELFHVGDGAVINMVSPTPHDKTSNKMISQISSVSDENLKTRLSSASDNYFTYSQSMSKSLQPVFEVLNTGLYVCHVSKMIPSDGSGNFFWNAYNVRHEITGSSEYNTIIGKENNYIPCFLIPTISIEAYNEPKARSQIEKLQKNKQIGGLAFHLTGMFSALLDGHHSATACLINDCDFNCIVIEPVRQVLYESPESAAENGRQPKIIALSCPYVKIPVSAVPESMMENFLIKRFNEKPPNYDVIKSKAGHTIRVKSKKAFSKQIYIKAELLPDCAMIESAHGITGLSDEQLNALLSGEVKYDDSIIISSNYYNSVIVACNYLQYEDFNRFLSFAFAILNNSDLIATHKYIADRLNNITDEKIYNYFKNFISNQENEASNVELIPIAESYITRYNNFLDENEREKKKNSRIRKIVPLGEGEVDSLGLAQMEAFIKSARGSSRKG